MKQIIFDSSYLLKPTTFLEDLTHSIFLRTAYLFNHSNCSHPSLEVVYLLLCFMAVIHSLKCTVLLSFVEPLAVVCCHSLSFVVTRCHSLSLVVILCHSLYQSLSLVLPLVIACCHSLYHSLSFLVPHVVIRCHSLPFVVNRCTTCCHSMYHSSVFL